MGRRAQMKGAGATFMATSIGMGKRAGYFCLREIFNKIVLPGHLWAIIIHGAAYEAAKAGQPLHIAASKGRKSPGPLRASGRVLFDSVAFRSCSGRTQSSVSSENHH